MNYKTMQFDILTGKFEYDSGDVSFNAEYCGLKMVITFEDKRTSVSIRDGKVMTLVYLDARPQRWEENAIVFIRAVGFAYVKNKAMKKNKSNMASLIQVHDHTTLVTEISTSHLSSKKVKFNYGKYVYLNGKK